MMLSDEETCVEISFIEQLGMGWQHIEVKRAERWDRAWDKPMRSLAEASGVKVGVYCGSRSYQFDDMTAWSVVTLWRDSMPERFSIRGR